MKKNADLPLPNTGLIYSLEVKIPEQTPRKFEVIESLSVGLDPRNDLILIDPKIKAKHFLFNSKENILSLNYLGREGDTLLNGLTLEKGKIYLLEKGDKLKSGRIEIVIREDFGIIKNKAPIPNAEFISELPKVESVDLAETFKLKQKLAAVPKKISQPNIKIQKAKNLPLKNRFSIIPYKIYSFIANISFTYLFLSYILPTLGFKNLFQNLLSPISEFSINYLENIHSPKLLSLVEFFICYHCLMISNALLFGTTPGAFLVGLGSKGKSSFFAKRFKAYFYALINIVFLPLIIFDVPLYRGRCLKEFLTFSEYEVRHTLFFKTLRRTLVPIFLIASIFSPFFLAPPMTSTITNDLLIPPKYKETHTNHLTTSSAQFGITLQNDINKQYALLPYFEKNKIGILFYDLVNNSSLILREENRITNKELLYRLRYSNPFASLTIPANQIENESLKNKTINSLHLSILNMSMGFREFGPFMANGILFKENFLSNFTTQDNFSLNTFGPKNPFIKVSSDNEKEQKVFLFAQNELITMSLTNPKQRILLVDFINSVLLPMRFSQSTGEGINSLAGQKDPQILEVLDAFNRKDHQTVLTYYIKEAKKAHEINNPFWRDTLIKNVELAKKTLFEGQLVTNKNIKKSFEDILKTL